MADHAMNPRISVITLGVSDLETSLAFYRDGMGWQTTGIIGTEFKGDETHPSGAVVMFQLQNGLTLALYPRTELAKDANEPLRAPSPTEFSLGYLVQNKEQVDAVIRRAAAAGAARAGGGRRSRSARSNSRNAKCRCR